jgi:hypothetical protein
MMKKGQPLGLAWCTNDSSSSSSAERFPCTPAGVCVRAHSLRASLIHSLGGASHGRRNETALRRKCCGTTPPPLLLRHGSAVGTPA